MKILFIDCVHELMQQELLAAGYTCDLLYDLNIEELLGILPNYEGVVIRSKLKFTSEVIDKAHNLKFIARFGAGMENIDVPYAQKKGIQCINAPEGNKEAVAEHALGMLLCLFNNLCKANQQVREKKWIREENRGYEIAGKTIGIIGYGNMGSAFAKVLTGFDCNILVYDKYKTGFSSGKIKEAEIDELFKNANIISLHTPYTPETHYMVNEVFLSSFKKNIYIINTARGKNINTADLVKHLKTGKVLGACLDVIEYETLSFENIESNSLPEAFQYLIKADNVVLSPHIAGWTHESNEKMARILTDKIKQLFPVK